MLKDGAAARSQKLGLAQSLEYAVVGRGIGIGWVGKHEVRSKVAPVVSTERWAIDGIYLEIGPMIAATADLIVWLDLPPRVWLPRLLRRSGRRLLLREELWNGNRETLRGVFFEADGVIPHAIRAYFFRRRGLARALAPYPYVRLQTVDAVESFAAGVR